MKAVPAWVSYSVYRVLMFVVPLVVLLVLQVDPWVATLLAAVIGLCLSYIFLQKPRESVSRDLYQVRHGTKGAAGTGGVSPHAVSDAETEDAALDLLEGESQGEQNAVGEPRETGEFQRKNQLP
jgi:hypothetical protein